MNEIAIEHGCNQVERGPDGRVKCVHWHRMKDFPGTDDQYPDEDFTGVRWLSLGFGFAVEEVHAGAEGDHWCYTVGLARYRHPEFLMQGYPYEATCVILSGLAWQVVRGERRFTASDSPIALGEGQVRLVREESEEAMEDYKFLPLANLRNGGAGGLDQCRWGLQPHGSRLSAMNCVGHATAWSMRLSGVVVPCCSTSDLQTIWLGKLKKIPVAPATR
jgi:Domain of unknown function (DUF4262)